jgi:translation initiation factor IF-3
MISRIFLITKLEPNIKPIENKDDRKDNRDSKEKGTRINRQITARELRLIADNGDQLGVMSFFQALKIAEEAGLDLVEISPTAQPPVCRIMDYGKFTFQKRKQQQVAKKNQKQIQIKEIKFRPATDEGDYQVKLRNLIKFLEGGDKAKVVLRFRGREMAHQDLGQEFLERIKRDLEPYGTVEQFPKMEGKQVVMLIGPKKK